MATANRDKHIVECWLKLYNRIYDCDFEVVDWPDKDSTKQAIDAVCSDPRTNEKLGIEHTLIQPFEGEKADTARFRKTLAALENHPTLVRKGYLVEISQPVGAIPTGVDWEHLQEEMVGQVESALQVIADDTYEHVTLQGLNWSFTVAMTKSLVSFDYPGKVLVGRIWPGDPGPALVIKALEDKVPKLSAFTQGKRILLLEKEASAGTIEQQFGQLPRDDRTRELLSGLDEIWSTNTVSLETEGVIFTNQVWPNLRAFTCSLNFRSGSFWQKPSWPTSVVA